jgi:hypothetical protein
MIDPLTLLATAKAAATGARAAIAAGREIASVVREYNKLSAAQNDLARLAADPPKGWGQKESAEEIAMKAFAAKKEAEELETEIRNYIVSEWGLNAWDQIQKEVSAIRKAQKEAALKRAQEEAEQKMVNLVITGAAATTLIIVSLLIWVISL